MVGSYNRNLRVSVFCWFSGKNGEATLEIWVLGYFGDG